MTKLMRKMTMLACGTTLLAAAFPMPARAAESSAILPPAPTVEDKLAMEVKKESRNNIVTLVYENDMIGNGADGEYTNGVRLGYLDVNAEFPLFAHRIADAIPGFDINETSSIFYSLGQNMFTPSDITLNPPPGDQRPYAGFLYGSVGMVTLTDNHSDEIELTLGMVGPASLAENTQKFVHRHITDSPLPKGWGQQLKNEPGIMLGWQRSYLEAESGEIGPLFWSFSPHYGLTLGNIYTFANAGFSIRISPEDSRWQDKPMRVRPALPGSGFFEIPEKKWSWYLFGGVDGRAMARNIFLDGNSFTNSPSVDKNIFVADSNAGIAFTYDQTRISYTVVHRTKEFADQRDSTVFGALTVGYRF